MRQPIIKLIQISDIHYQNDSDTIVRVKRLSEDLRAQLYGPEPAYLVLTGDIVQAGDAGQFHAFIDNFVLPNTELFHGIVTCPGNHDVQRSQNDPLAIDKIANDALGAYVYDNAGKLALKCPFVKNNLESYFDFEAFCTESLFSSYYGSTHLFPEFSVVSLNTAWLSRERSSGESDRERLRIQPEVIKHLAKPCPVDRLRLAIMHHPLDWLTEDIRQDVEDALTETFDAVLFGHAHSPSSIAGSFRGGKCLMLQAPTVRSHASRGANAYTMIRVACQDKRFELTYRTYSHPRGCFIAGDDIAENGIWYPSDNDASFWFHYKNTEPNEISSYFTKKLEDIDFTAWSQKHVVQKGGQFVDPIEPDFIKITFENGEKTDLPQVGLFKCLSPDIKRQFFIGPSDSGISMAAYLTVRHISENAAVYGRIPSYINVSHISVNRATLIAEAARNCPVALTNGQIETIARAGKLTFVIDGVNFSNTEKYNRVMDVVEKYFPTCHCFLFCARDGDPIGSSGGMEVRLDPMLDSIYQIAQLRARQIRKLVELHFPDRPVQNIEEIVDSVIESFKSMDEPVFPSTVGLLLETLKRIPDFRPINRVRLLDRYVEVLLGRFDIEDVKVGSFGSTDKLSVISYLAGHFARSGSLYLEENEWGGFIKRYSTETMLAVPEGLLEEFISKGILFSHEGKITFRADYLFSYFVAREMHRNFSLREYVLGGERFFCFHKEIAAYGELEGVDNGALIENVHEKLIGLEETITKAYTAVGIDLDQEMRAMLVDEEAGTAAKILAESTESLYSVEGGNAPSDEHRDGTLSRVQRARGVLPREEIRQLEGQWFSTLITYLKLLRHADNLNGDKKVLHVGRSLQSAEIFLKTVAAKRSIISSYPAFMFDGILYFNPLASIDLERSKSEFRYNVTRSIGRTICESLSNPKHSPVFRTLLGSESEVVNYLLRRLILEHTLGENSTAYTSSLLDSKDQVFQACSLRDLKQVYVYESYDGERRQFLESILNELSRKRQIKDMFSSEAMKKSQILQRLRRGHGERDKH